MHDISSLNTIVTAPPIFSIQPPPTLQPNQSAPQPPANPPPITDLLAAILLALLLISRSRSRSIRSRSAFSLSRSRSRSRSRSLSLSLLSFSLSFSFSLISRSLSRSLSPSKIPRIIFVSFSHVFGGFSVACKFSEREENEIFTVVGYSRKREG